jgi:hypothetical protein
MLAEPAPGMDPGIDPAAGPSPEPDAAAGPSAGVMRNDDGGTLPDGCCGRMLCLFFGGRGSDMADQERRVCGGVGWDEKQWKVKGEEPALSAEHAAGGWH